MLLQTSLFLVYPYAVDNWMLLSSKSSLTLSIHFFLCLLLLLSPLTCPCSAVFASLFPSILSTCPNHISLLLIVFSITVSSAPSDSGYFYSASSSPLLLRGAPTQHWHCVVVSRWSATGSCEWRTKGVNSTNVLSCTTGSRGSKLSISCPVRLMK